MTNQPPRAAKVSLWYTIEYPDNEVEDMSVEHHNALAAYFLGTTCPGCPRLGNTPPAKVTARKGAKNG